MIVCNISVICIYFSCCNKITTMGPWKTVSKFFWTSIFFGKTNTRHKYDHQFDKTKGLYDLLWVVIHGPLRTMFHNFIYLNPNKKVKNHILLWSLISRILFPSNRAPMSTICLYIDVVCLIFVTFIF
jgi:hypothetical protein